MGKMKKWLFFLILQVSVMGIFAAENPLALLNPREPNWRMEVVEKYPEGQPKEVLFFRPITQDKEEVSQKIIYYPNGSIYQASDMGAIAKESPTYDKWKSCQVPSGMFLQFHDSGNLGLIAGYKDGELEGVRRSFYPSGKIESEVAFIEGKPHGEMVKYNEEGKKI
jgi:antitoxin component YwqK of YwqJK toxin-antitoxin module